MTNREAFINEIQLKIDAFPDFLSPAATAYFQELIQSNKTAGKITENGERVLRFMAENEKQYMNIFSASAIGEGLFLAPKSITGSMKKLIVDGYVTKQGNNPVQYSLTDTARTWHKENFLLYYKKV